MKRLQTQQHLLSTKPTSYRKIYVETLRDVVTEAEEVFRQFKKLNKSFIVPKLLTLESKTSINICDKVIMLSEFFQSVFSPQEAVSLIFKKSDRRLVENYRPVSLLNIICKIFNNVYTMPSMSPLSNTQQSMNRVL